jgi:uncharacterized membrane protein
MRKQIPMRTERLIVWSIFLILLVVLLVSAHTADERVHETPKQLTTLKVGTK